jgi:DNA-binding transcriptional MerR regulator
MAQTPPPDDPAWVDIRARYEAGTESVLDIATSIGLSRMALSMTALKQGWKMRGLRTGKGKTPKAKAAPPSTRETISRLKDMLQQRVASLEQELKDLGTEVSALNNERGIKSANMLVRTLEKVLDLERKDKLKRKKAIHDFKYFDEEQRRLLAEKIERLEAERDRDLVVAGAGDPGSGGVEQPVALLDPAGASAAAGTG